LKKLVIQNGFQVWQFGSSSIWSATNSDYVFISFNRLLRIQRKAR
jgi:hypothetical protein